MTPIIWLLWGALFTAAAFDLRVRRIPNWLTFGMMLAGILWHSVMPGDLTASDALLGCAIGLALHLGLYALQLEGAGDGKMMGAVGAVLGWQLMLEATLWRYIFLVPYAIIAITVYKRWHRLKEAVVWTVLKVTAQPVGDRPEPLKLPFGPVIAVAVIFAQATTVLNGILGF